MNINKPTLKPLLYLSGRFIENSDEKKLNLTGTKSPLTAVACEKFNEKSIWQKFQLFLGQSWLGRLFGIGAIKVRVTDSTTHKIAPLILKIANISKRLLISPKDINQESFAEKRLKHVEAIASLLDPEELSKATHIDLKGSPHISGEELLLLGNHCPNLKTISLKNCKGLMELDSIKGYVEKFYTDPSLNTSSAHKAIFKALQEHLQMGTQPIYFNELTYKFAREALLKDFASTKKLPAFKKLSAHQKNCVQLILSDLGEHKFHINHPIDPELPSSHNGATRSTLTEQDLALYGKGLTQYRAVKPPQGEDPTLTLDRAFKTRIEGFKSALDAVRRKLERELPTEYIRDLPKILTDLKDPDPSIRQKAAKAAVLIKAAMVDFGDTQGRLFALSDLGKIGPLIGLDDPQTKTLKALINLSETFSPEIDHATLEWMSEQNYKARNHPTVGVIGGGPTGLFAALELFTKGANVIVSEERDAAYIRHQIVRLDPLWVNKLKFYLGTKFEAYFGAEDRSYAGESKPQIGNRSGDGFVECVINHLETRLRDRVVELNSFTTQKPFQQVELFAAHSVEPKFVRREDGRFLLTHKFNPEKAELKFETVVIGKNAAGQDITRRLVTGGVRSPPKDEFVAVSKSFPVDIVFDVAGKHSKIREGNVMARDVTGSAPHTVASFFVRGECLSYRKEDHDFRRQYLITPDFLEYTSYSILKAVTDHANKSLNASKLGIPLADLQILKEGICKSLASNLKAMKEKIEDFERFPIQEGILRRFAERSLVYETRTFVNTDSQFTPDPDAAPRGDGGVSRLRVPDSTAPLDPNGKPTRTIDEDRPDNILYLGMEIPRPIKKLYEEMESSIRRYLETVGVTDKKAIKNLVKSFIDEANLTFVMSVAHEQELDRPLNDEPGAKPWVAKEYADRKFLSVFDVTQGSVLQGVTVREGANGGYLVQACGGDSAASPHFMRYSGLSGAREHVGVMGDLVQQLSRFSRKPSLETMKGLVKHAQHKYQSINDFVLSRGNVFLPTLSPAGIAENILKELKKMLNEEHFIENVGGQKEAYKLLYEQIGKEASSWHNKPTFDELQTWFKINNILEKLQKGHYRLFES